MSGGVSSLTCVRCYCNNWEAEIGERLGDGLAGVWVRCRTRWVHFLHGGRDATRSQGSVLAASYWFRLRMCFLGDAYAGVSCRVQLGAPPAATRLRC